MHRLVVRLALALAPVMVGAVVMAGAACDPVKLPHQMPGPPGCGMRDPNNSGPSTMSVAQNTVIKNNGHPYSAEPNEHGGRNWLYSRATGSVFGEQEAIDLFIFDAQGLVVAQKTEVRKQVGK